MGLQASGSAGNFLSCGGDREQIFDKSAWDEYTLPVNWVQAILLPAEPVDPQNLCLYKKTSSLLLLHDL